MRHDFSPGDFESQLRRIEASRLEYFVEGGQAANIWAEVYAATVPAITDLAPFTSKDCDLWVGYELFKRIEQVLPGGTLTKATDPAQGAWGNWVTSTGSWRTLWGSMEG